MGLSLNQAIRNHLEQLAGGGSVDVEVDELRALSEASGGRSAGVRIDRDELHDRSPS